MTIQQNYNELYKLLKQSPLLSANSLIQDEGLMKLKQYRKELDIIQEKFVTPLKMVIMGEVKAGKSTLLNTFAGGVVSPTNVTEATACIIEIKQGTDEGQIKFKDGETFVGSTTEVFDLLETYRGNEEYFSNVEVVALSFPLQNLASIHLVDTPGLGTVTQSNEDTTLEFIQKADVVLWVFSAHHLGQSDIEDQLENIKSYGKPVIAVINRLDEVSAEANELEMYIEDHLGFYIDEAFAISAYNAYQAIRSQDNELLKSSRFPLLLEYLDREIERQVVDVHESSIITSIKSIIEKEKIQHQIVIDYVDYLFQSMNKRKEEFKYFKDTINNRMATDLNQWGKGQLLEVEKDKLITQVNSFGMLTRKADYERISKELEHYISSEYLIELLEFKFSHLNTLFKSEWQHAIKIIGENIQSEDEIFNKEISVQYGDLDISFDIRLPESENTMANGAIKGATIGGATGIAAASYAAVLGPYAASITLGAALSAFLLPVVLIGGAAGVATKFFSGKKVNREYSIEVVNTINEVRSKVQLQVLPNLITEIENRNIAEAMKLYNNYCISLTGGHSEENLQELRNLLKSYLYSLSEIEQQFIVHA